MKTIRIGSGAGYAGDRIEPAVELIEQGELDYIMFECLAERTIALGQLAKLADPTKGYNHLLEARMRRILEPAARKGVTIITNMGSANPVAAAETTAAIAGELGLTGLRIAAVTGDDITAGLTAHADKPVLELGGTLADLGDVVISANVYLGSEGILDALAQGADVIITGRCADPSLAIAPLVHEFGWTVDANPDQFGQAVLVGHLLECAGQVTGGYYADPGHKDVPDLARLGFPLVEVAEDGSFVLTKVAGSGGLVTPDTCKEQMIYEIHDPSRYLTPDAIADFSRVTFTPAGPDRVACAGATSHGRPETLKVSVGYQDCYLGNGEISYGGSTAQARAELAAEVLRERFEIIGAELDEVRYDLIGVNSLYGDKVMGAIDGAERVVPHEVRLRVCGRARDRATAALVGNEVEALYTNGPAGGGGATTSVAQIVSICSIFVPRDDVASSVSIKEVSA